MSAWLHRISFPFSVAFFQDSRVPRSGVSESYGNRFTFHFTKPPYPSTFHYTSIGKMIQSKMRTIYVVILAVGVAVLVGMSALFVTSAATGRPIMFGQSQSSYSNGGGMMDSYSSSGGGMMGSASGSGGGMMDGSGGMMGNSYNGTYTAEMMGNLTNGNLTSYMGRMMGGSYGNFSSWCFQYMSKFFGQIWNMTK